MDIWTEGAIQKSSNNRQVSPYGFFKKATTGVLLGLLVFVLYGATVFFISLLSSNLKSSGDFELGLFLGAFIPAALTTFLGLWFLLFGKFIKSTRPKIIGKYLIGVSVLVPIISYFGSTAM